MNDDIEKFEKELVSLLSIACKQSIKIDKIAKYYKENNIDPLILMHDKQKVGKPKMRKQVSKNK